MLARIKSLSLELTDCRIIPILCWILFPALIVRGHFTPVLPEAAFLSSSPVCGDTRSWWKAVFICGIGLWMLFHLIIRTISGWRPQHLRFALLLGLAALSTLISAFLSKYPQTSWLGYTNLYEGTAVLLSYLVAAWYIAEMVSEAKMRLLLVRTIGVVGLINGCHGIAEGFGWHLWQSDFGLWLMGASRGAVMYTFSDSRMAYGTVFQPNHYGMLMAMLGSLAIGMYFYESLRRWRCFWLVVFLSAIGGILFSQSRTGAFTFTSITFIAIIRRVIVKGEKGGRTRTQTWKYVLVFCVLLALSFGIMPIRRAFNSLLERSRSIFVMMPQSAEIKAVGLQNNQIHISLSDQTIILAKRSPGTWIVNNQGASRRGVLLQFDEMKDDGWHVASIPSLPSGLLYCRDQGNIKLSATDAELNFYSAGTRLWMVDLNNRQLYATMPLIPSSITGFEGLLSGRGFIWTRVFSLIRNCPLWGSGPGTFALSFPNLDLLSRHRFSFDLNADKGHGIWATFLIHLGIIGLLAYCIPVIYIILKGIRVNGMMRMPLLMAMLAYCICSLANDSSVGVTPIFCVLLGVTAADSAFCKDGIGVRRAFFA